MKTWNEDILINGMSYVVPNNKFMSTSESGHLTVQDTSLFRTLLISLIRTPDQSGYRINQDTSLIRTPHQSGYLTNQDTSPIRILSSDPMYTILRFIFNPLIPHSRTMLHFCQNYLRSVASKEVTDFKTNLELQTVQFTQFEVSLSMHCWAGFNPGGAGGQTSPKDFSCPPPPKHMTPSTIPLLPCQMCPPPPSF